MTVTTATPVVRVAAARTMEVVQVEQVVPLRRATPTVELVMDSRVAMAAMPRALGLL